MPRERALQPTYVRSFLVYFSFIIRIISMCEKEVYCNKGSAEEGTRPSGGAAG